MDNRAPPDDAQHDLFADVYRFNFPVSVILKAVHYHRELFFAPDVHSEVSRVRIMKIALTVAF